MKNNENVELVKHQVNETYSLEDLERLEGDKYFFVQSFLEKVKKKFFAVYGLD